VAASILGSSIGVAVRAVDDKNADVVVPSLSPFPPKPASDFAGRLLEASRSGANEETAADTMSATATVSEEAAAGTNVSKEVSKKHRLNQKRSSEMSQSLDGSNGRR